MLYGIFEVDAKTGQLFWCSNFKGTGDNGRFTQADMVEAFKPHNGPYQFAVPLAALFRDSDDRDAVGELWEDSTPT